MNLPLMHQLARKLSAVSFIVLILIGHFWTLMVLLGESPRPWLSVCFLVGVVGALSGGLVLLVLKLAAIISALRGK